MKRTVCAASVLAVVALAAASGVRGQGQDAPTLKQIMGKLHKGANSHLAKLKTALKAESPDWKAVQDQTKDVVILGAALAKNEPPKGDRASYEKLADAYFQNAKALDDAAKAEDKAKSQTALGKLGASCKSCHAAHKGR